MCMAIPSQVVELSATGAVVECFGRRREVDLALLDELQPPLAPGDYLLLRSGRFAVERIEPGHALEVLALLARELA